MSKNTKIRGMIWLLLAIAGVIAAGIASYTQQVQNLAGDVIFQDKTEDQVAIEFLELYSYKYDEDPIISGRDDDYSFDVYRAVFREDSLVTNLYIVAKDLAFAGDERDPLPTVGLIDFLVYCSTEEDKYHKQVGYTRLGEIAGTNVYANFMDLDRGAIEGCESNEFVLVMDSSRSELLYGKDILEEYNLSDIFNVQIMATSAILDNSIELSDGFLGDLTKSTYNVYSYQRAFLYGGLSILLIFPIAFGLFYVTERELFENNILKGRKK